jgi:hypothetical protein
MPFDGPAGFRLDRIAVRPIHWLWRPYLACGKLALRSGPIRPCRTAPDHADEGKADRPPSRVVSALRPWPALRSGTIRSAEGAGPKPAALSKGEPRPCLALRAWGPAPPCKLRHYR